MGGHAGTGVGSGAGLLSVWEDGRNSPTMGLDIYGAAQTISLPTLSGHVYEGNAGDTTAPLAGAGVALSCSSSAGSLGTVVGAMTTDATGSFSLPVPGQCEVYHLRETDPAGYVSVSAASVSGQIVDANWIRYVYPLTGKTLSGNAFWDVVAGPTDTLPPANWANFSPQTWVATHSAPVSVQVEDSQSGLDVGTAEFDMSTDNGVTWRGWAAATCSGADGTTTPQLISVTVPFNQDGDASGPTKCASASPTWTAIRVRAASIP